LREPFTGRSQSQPPKSGGLPLGRFLPGLQRLRHYDRRWLSADLTAGVSVAAVAVPIAIAYSQLAGVPPAHGLYASILPLLAYAAFGSSRQLIMAPDAATCAIVAATVLPLAGGDAQRYVSLTAALAIATGIVCIVAGLAGLGFLTNFLARPILTGYLNGIAISIIVGQLGRLFGFQLQSGGFFVVIADFFSKVGQTHWPTLAIGGGILALMRVLKRAGPRVPAPLVAVGAGIVLAFMLDLDQRGVALLGAIPAGLPPLSIPAVQPSELTPLALGALGLALISYNSAMVTARGFALKNRYDIDSNQEFIALGVADIGAGLLQGFAVSGADSRTAARSAAGVS
jgi:MFS superfamily sulfate permease-like transporter